MGRHPGLRHHADLRSLQDRLADSITAFSGSMLFVYIHIVWFAVWLLLHMDINLLTMIVSLEAIFLATFVLISQNRADAKRSAIADHDHQVDCETLALLKRVAEQMGIDT